LKSAALLQENGSAVALAFEAWQHDGCCKHWQAMAMNLSHGKHIQDCDYSPLVGPGWNSCDPDESKLMGD
jgi:hypothetical protein